MYVCLCHGVTETQIEAAVANGARCMGDLRKSLNVTSTCGRCASCARNCLRQAEPAQLINNDLDLLEVS